MTKTTTIQDVFEALEGAGYQFLIQDGELFIRMPLPTDGASAAHLAEVNRRYPLAMFSRQEMTAFLQGRAAAGDMLRRDLDAACATALEIERQTSVNVKLMEILLDGSRGNRRDEVISLSFDVSDLDDMDFLAFDLNMRAKALVEQLDKPRV